MLRLTGLAGVLSAAMLVLSGTAWGDTVTVNTVDGLRNAITNAPVGQPRRIYVQPGTYSSRLWVGSVRRTPTSVIEIVASDPSNRPIFNAHSDSCFTLNDCAYFVVDGIIGQEAADTGGNALEFANSDHMVMRNCLARNLLNQGNSDAIKFASTNNILAYNNKVENWARGGSGFDIMNNRNSLYMRNYITYPTLPAYEGANGFQPKSNSAYENGFYKNYFYDGGARAQQFGGSSGATQWEGRDMVAMGNIMDLGEAAVAYVSCTRSDFSYNTIKNPEVWVMRILNENTPAGAAYWTAYNTFRRNLIYYGNVTVQNISGSTRAETFTYAEDYWYKSTDPTHSIPTLAAPESSPAGGVDPQLDSVYRPHLAAAKAYGAFAPGMEAAWSAYTAWFDWAWQKALEYEPDARAGGPYTVGPGGRTRLNGGGSYAGVGSYGAYSIGAYEWDLDYDSFFDDAAGQAPWATYAFLTGTLGLGPGAHTIELKISVPTEYQTMYDYGLGELRITSQVADADADGAVRFDDYQALERNFGVTLNATWDMGDFDGDGDVDFTDYQILERNFGAGVPEPATLSLLALAGFVALVRRRR